MAKKKRSASQIVDALKAQGAAALASLAGAFAQSPTAHAMRNTRAVNVPQAGTVADNPEVMRAITELAARVEAGGPIMSPLLGGEVATMQGRQPITGMGWGGGAVDPELEQKLIAMSQPQDAGAGARMSDSQKYNLRRSLAKEKAAKIAADAERDASFENYDPEAEHLFRQNAEAKMVTRFLAQNDRNTIPGTRTALNPDDRAVKEAIDLHSPEAAAARKEALLSAAGNVNLMSAAAAVARKQRMGALPNDVSGAGILASVTPDDNRRVYIDPVTGTKLRQIEAYSKAAEQDAESRKTAAELDAEARKSVAEINAKAQGASDTAATARQTAADTAANARTQMQLDAEKAEREARTRASEAQFKLSTLEAEMRLNPQSPDNLAKDEQARILKEKADAEIADIKLASEEKKRLLEADQISRKYDPFKDVQDPHIKSTAWSEHVSGKMAAAAMPNAPIPAELEHYLNYVYANRGSLYGASWGFDEGDFETYVASKFPNIDADAVGAVAEKFWEKKTGSW